MELNLIRRITANGAVVSELNGLSKRLYVLEDAWNNNQRGNSCIPEGRYTVKPHGWELQSPFKFKQVWQLENVPGRNGVLIHGGNYIKDTEGCLLVGLGMMISQTQSMITDSRIALEFLRKEIGNQQFVLTIEGL